MEEVKDATQLPLSVKVSPWSGVSYTVNRTVREFRYTSLVQVLSNFIFWINVGVVVCIYFYLQSKSLVLLNGIGVLIAPAAKSNIPLFIAAAVNNLTLLPFIWYGMCATLLAFTVISIVTHGSGRYSMVNYLQTICLLLLLLLAKAIASPILLIGG